MKTIWNRKAAGVAKKPESKIKAFKIKQTWISRLRKISAQVAIAKIKNYSNPVVFATVVFLRRKMQKTLFTSKRLAKSNLNQNVKFAKLDLTYLDRIIAEHVIHFNRFVNNLAKFVEKSLPSI
jgi:hypothetical protein